LPIVADIDDLAPAEFLLMLSLTEKTGKLSAVSEGKKTLLVFQMGAIVYAASPVVRERFGSLLVTRGMVTEEILYEALERQRSDPTRPLLGSVLMEMNAVSPDDLREVLQLQFERVIREMLSWQGGVMIFDSMEIPDMGAMPVDPTEVLMALGVDTNNLLVESLSQIQANRPQREPRTPQEVLESSDSDAEQQVSAGVPEADKQGVVRSLLEEMDGLSVALTAEMTLSVLGAAGDVAERALLLSVSPLHLSGIGGFGPGRDGTQLTGRDLRIARDRRSIFTEVLSNRSTYRGPLDDGDGNGQLIEELGGPPRGEVLAVPLIVKDEVVALLYADGGPGGSELGSAEAIEGTMGLLASTLEGKRDPAAGPEWKFSAKRDREPQEASH
jgi:hypothetical protein